tara:strand:- start:1557 stop:2408 length:852 start_codon:yes stop_codon:yes gene_type:complete
MTSLKTPLRYPGGKSRAVKKMSQFLPDMKRYKEYREPFLGGGSVALYMTQTYPHLEIWVNDLYEPLYNFWTQLQDEANEITTKLRTFKTTHPTPEKAKELFLESKELVNDEKQSNVDRACYFYVVNKCSFSGLTESSSFSSQASDSNFSLRGIEKLPEYSKLIENWIITNLTYERMLINDWDRKGIFTYMDPPYEIKSSLYGKKGSMHKGFDHDDFAKNCDDYTSPLLISYNSSQLIKDRFADWDAQEYDHTYTMRSVGEYMKEQQSRKELLLLNYESGSDKK